MKSLRVKRRGRNLAARIKKNSPSNRIWIPVTLKFLNNLAQKTAEISTNMRLHFDLSKTKRKMCLQFKVGK